MVTHEKSPRVSRTEGFRGATLIDGASIAPSTLRYNGLTRICLAVHGSWFTVHGSQFTVHSSQLTVRQIDSPATFGGAYRAGLAAGDPASLASVSHLLLRIAVVADKVFKKIRKMSLIIRNLLNAVNPGSSRAQGLFKVASATRERHQFSSVKASEPKRKERMEGFLLLFPAREEASERIVTSKGRVSSTDSAPHKADGLVSSNPSVRPRHVGAGVNPRKRRDSRKRAR